MPPPPNPSFIHKYSYKYGFDYKQICESPFLNYAHCSQEHDPTKTDAILLFFAIRETKYRVIQNDCQGFNNLSYTIHLR